SRGIEPGTAEAAAGTRAAEPATRARATEPPAAWTRPAEPASGPRSAGPAVFTSPCFANRERPSVEHLAVESLDRLLGVGAILTFDEREAPRPARFAIHRQDHLRGRCDSTEVAAQVGFSGAVREIAYEQTDGQSTLS